MIVPSPHASKSLGSKRERCFNRRRDPADGGYARYSLLDIPQPLTPTPRIRHSPISAIRPIPIRAALAGSGTGAADTIVTEPPVARGPIDSKVESSRIRLAMVMALTPAPVAWKVTDASVPSPA